MATRVVASRLLVRRAAAMMDTAASGNVDGINKEAKESVAAICAMAKAYATEECWKVCDEALQLHGGIKKNRE